MGKPARKGRLFCAQSETPTRLGQMGVRDVFNAPPRRAEFCWKIETSEISFKLARFLLIYLTELLKI